MPEFNFRPAGEQARNFMRSNKFFRGLRGPVGSGKSVTCAAEILRRAAQQKPSPIDGIRRTRWAVIRNTNPMLRTTTMKTWEEWYPEDDGWGATNWTPPFTHHIKLGDIDCEVIFLPLDTEEDIKRLLSLELTGAWLNEAREIRKVIVDNTLMRCGRYPSKRHGGPTWYGAWADTNSPDELHWWGMMDGAVPIPDSYAPEQKAELKCPKDWAFFIQPPGMTRHLDPDGEISGYTVNPDAENIENLPPDYYSRIIQGKDRSWVNVYVLNQIGRIKAGKPIYPGFRREVHVARETIPVNPDFDLHVGIDFGLTPAAVVAHYIHNRVFILAEIIAENMGTERFAEFLKADLFRRFHRAYGERLIESCRFTGDPAGEGRAQTDEKTPFMILRANGIRATKAHTNDPGIRIGSVERLINRMVDGKPGLVVDPSAVTMIAGFESGYHYRKLRVSGADRYHDQPEKNQYSHPHDAFQYAVLGMGEGRDLTLGTNRNMKPVTKRSRWNVFDRMKGPATRPGPRLRRG